MIKPMLAHEYIKYKDKINWPAIAQYKIDGVRCIYYDGSFYTRNGKPIIGVPKLLAEVSSIVPKGTVIDGELYSKELTFQEIVSVVRRSVCLSEDPKIEYWMFDIINDSRCIDRLCELKNIKCTSRMRVLNFEIVSQESLQHIHQSAASEGFEGIIIRDVNGRYEHKRSKNLLKLKHDKSIEVTCVAIAPGQGRFRNTTGAIECSYKGKLFRVGSGLTEAQRDMIYLHRNHYLGKTLTVKFQSFTDQGIPRFPVFVDWRDYE